MLREVSGCVSRNRDWGDVPPMMTIFLVSVSLVVAMVVDVVSMSNKVGVVDVDVNICHTFSLVALSDFTPAHFRRKVSPLESD